MNSFYKIAALLASAAALLVSCDETAGNDVSVDDDFAIVFDKNVITADGNDAVTFTATLKGEDVTANTVFYLGEGLDMTELSGNKFVADKTGLYKISASYLTFVTSEPLIINAINVSIPAAAEDPQPSKTSFVHRAFLNQYTGTGCQYCPGMIRAIRSAMADETVADMAVLAAIHSYGAGDPAYISSPRTTNYPYLQIDMADDFTYDQDPEAKRGVLKSLLQARTSSPAKVGISANPNYYEEEQMLVVRVAVKAAETGSYNLGVWFLQDNVYGIQNDGIGIADNSYNYHDNCVRVADSRWMYSYVGYPVGTIQAGKTVERTFVLPIMKTEWKLKDMNDIHFAAFVTSADSGGKTYSVVNVIDCKYNEPTPFDYK